MKARIIIIVLLFGITAHGQETAKKIISGYVERMGQIGLPEDGKTYYMDMSVRNEYNGDKAEPSNFDIEVFLTKGQMRYSSALMSVFQDTADALVVLPANRQIYWTRSTHLSNQSERRKQLSDFQLEIIKTGKIQAVSEENSGSHKFRVVSLEPSSEVSEKFGVRQLVFYYSRRENRVVKVKILYKPGQKLRSQEYIYRVFDLNYQKAGKEIPAKDYIFDKSGKLLEKYKGYQLTDNRV